MVVRIAFPGAEGISDASYRRRWRGCLSLVFQASCGWQGLVTHGMLGLGGLRCGILFSTGRVSRVGGIRGDASFSDAILVSRAIRSTRPSRIGIEVMIEAGGRVRLSV